MEDTSHLPSYDEAISDGLLQQQRRPSIHLKSVVELFMKWKESGLDGSIHAALNTNNPNIIFDRKNSAWNAVEPTEDAGVQASEQSAHAPKSDPNRHKWVDDTVPEDPCFQAVFKNIKKDEENFRNAVAKYVQEAKAKYKVGIDLSEAHSIEDVLVVIRATIKVYESKAEKGFLAPFRKAFRRLGDHQTTYRSWIQLAPTQSTYFSLVCGGVMLLLEAAERLREINDEIVEALAEIPLLVDKSQRLLAVYSSSPNMQIHCTELYTKVLHVLGGILQFYGEKVGPKVFKVVMTQKMFQQGLERKIADLKTCSDMIEEERKVCATETGVATNRTTRETNKVSKATYENVSDVKENVADVKEEVTAIKHELQLTRAALNNITSLFLASQMSPDLQLSSNKTYSRTSEKSTTAPLKTSHYQDNLPTRKELLHRLGYQHRITRIDRETNLMQISRLRLSDQNRAVYIMQSSILQAWLNSTSSSVLLINGNMPRSGTRQTPISFVSAKLADALHQSRSPALINLHFFCGEHDSWSEDQDSGPAAVWNSLLAQLLLQHDGFEAAQFRQLSRLDTSDVRGLGRMFGKMLQQLPREALVFCIVDSVSRYDDDRRNEAEELTETLIELVRVSERRNGCFFKLLLTATTRLGLDAVDYLDNIEEVLHVPTNFPKGGGFGDLDWEDGMAKDIGEIVGV